MISTHRARFRWLLPVWLHLNGSLEDQETRCCNRHRLPSIMGGSQTDTRRGNFSFDDTFFNQKNKLLDVNGLNRSARRHAQHGAVRVSKNDMTSAWLPIHQPVCFGYGLEALDPPIQRICLHLRKRFDSSNHLCMILPVTLQCKLGGTLPQLLTNVYAHPGAACVGAKLAAYSG